MMVIAASNAPPRLRGRLSRSQLLQLPARRNLSRGKPRHLSPTATILPRNLRNLCAVWISPPMLIRSPSRATCRAT